MKGSIRLSIDPERSGNPVSDTFGMWKAATGPVRIKPKATRSFRLAGKLFDEKPEPSKPQPQPKNGMRLRYNIPGGW